MKSIAMLPIALIASCVNACTQSPQARYAAELQNCIALSTTRDAADLCRAEVDSKYQDAEGFTMRDAGKGDS